MSGRTITRLSSKTLGSLSLAQQFFLAGGLVTLGATVLIGLLVTDQIVETVTRNAGSTTALYVDSIIAPILPDLTRATKLDDSIERTLDELWDRVHWADDWFPSGCGRKTEPLSTRTTSG